MGNLIKGLAEVQEDAVNLPTLIQRFGQIVDGCEQLGLAGPLPPKATLEIRKDLVVIQV